MDSWIREEMLKGDFFQKSRAPHLGGVSYAAAWVLPNPPPLNLHELFSSDGTVAIKNLKKINI